MTSENTPPLDRRRLEGWLRQLENALQDVSVVDRSDIVMELHTHIRESYERGDRSLEEILSGLGEPAHVANRYRVDRGMQPVDIPKPQSRLVGFFKWVTIGLLGWLTITTIFVIVMLIFAAQFLPLVQVDEKAGRVKILGGMIDVKE
jgi:uncharacterized membrane protein